METQTENITVKSDFILDRQFGFPIIVPVKKGIVQKFDDHEYNGVLSGKTEGKHITNLAEAILKLHNTWIKHPVLFNNSLYEIEILEKSVIIKQERINEVKNGRETEGYKKAVIEECTREINRISEIILDLKQKRKIITDKLFKEHGIQF